MNTPEAHASRDPELNITRMPAKYHPSSKVPLPPRTFLLTIEATDLEWMTGFGLTLDEVIAAKQESARNLWECYRDGVAGGTNDLTPEGYARDCWDVVVWENTRVRAVLRLTVAARPNYQVITFGDDGDRWRTFRILTPRMGDTVGIVEGVVTLDDAVRSAVEDILLEHTRMTPDDRLIFESGELVEVVRAGVATGDAEPSNPREARYYPSEEESDAQDIRKLIARGRTSEEAEKLVRGE